MMLRNMLPVCPRNDGRNSSSTDAIFRGKAVLSSKPLGMLSAYFDNLPLGQFGDVAAPFSVTVSNVFLMRTKKEMRNANASWVIAVVTNFYAERYCSIFHLPSEAMGKNAVAFYIKHAIAGLGSASRPLPAAVRCILVDFQPKSFCGGDAAFIVPTMPPNKADRLPSYLAAVCPGLSCNASRFAAAALAKVYGGVVRGMICHVDTFLSRFGHAAGRFQRRCGASISLLHYSTNGRTLPLGEVR